MTQPAVIVFICIIVNVMLCTVNGSPQITAHEYPLIHYTKLISDEYFTAGLPLVLVLPLAEEDSTNKELGYLIEKLQTSSRWHVMVYNVSYEMKGNMFEEIHQHGGYIIPISGPCKKWEQNTFGFLKQLSVLSEGELRKSWNPRARLLVPVMSNCTQFETTKISRSILRYVWTYQGNNAFVLFQKSNKHAGNVLQQKTADSTQGTYLELHTWYPSENSQRCNPIEGTVPVRVFTVRNVSYIKGSNIFKGYYVQNFHGCPIRVYVHIISPFVNPPKRIWYKDSGSRNVYEDGWEVELLRIIGNALNMSLNIKEGTLMENHMCHPCVYLGGVIFYHLLR